jgi:hypothetical protein
LHKYYGRADSPACWCTFCGLQAAVEILEAQVYNPHSNRKMSAVRHMRREALPRQASITMRAVEKLNLVNPTYTLYPVQIESKSLLYALYRLIVCRDRVKLCQQSNFVHKMKRRYAICDMRFRRAVLSIFFSAHSLF